MYSPPRCHSSGGSASPSSRSNTPPPVWDYGSDEESIQREKPFTKPYHPNQYTYTSIDPNQIRLLLLSQGQGDDKVQCSLKTIEVKKVMKIRMKFQALSYAWGKGAQSECIYLQDLSVPQNEGDKDHMMLLMAQQVKPRPFYVGTNLFNALKQIRSDSKDLWLWVDAICINQEDDKEKSHQISKMPDIYGNAWTVTIWIGESNGLDLAESAMDFVPSILNLKLLDRLTQKEGCDEQTLKSWVSFAVLLKRTWFSRRWVVQEVAFAKRAAIRCGSKIISWIDFADAIDLFMKKIELIRALYESSELSQYDPDAFNHVESAGSKIIIEATSSVFRKTEKGVIVDRLMDLESLVMKFKYLEATDSRDVIYAFLSLAKDFKKRSNSDSEHLAGEDVPITPQYDKKRVEVYAEFVEYVIKTTDSLDIICRHWALPIRTELGYNYKMPSWVGNIKNSPYGLPSQVAGRVNGDSLVGDPGRSAYNASGKLKLCVVFGEGYKASQLSLTRNRRKPWLVDPEDSPTSDENEDLSEDSFRRSSDAEQKRKRKSVSKIETQEQPGSATMAERYGIDKEKSPDEPPELRIYSGTITVKGVILHRISRVSPRVVDGTISDECFKILGWKHGHDENGVPDQVWRTLVADRGPDGKNAPAWYKRACIYALRKTSAEGDLNTSKLIANKSLPESVTEYLKRVQSVVWSRRFFESKSTFESRGNKEASWLEHISAELILEENLLGIGSKDIEQGDLVCLLFGCSVPVILRQAGRPGDDKCLPVKMIGECFVYGNMDGEVFGDLLQNSEQSVLFKIK